MASFVLIHGSWHGGWCFDAVRAELEALGHEVFAPDLPGMGGSDAELAAVTLAGWGDFAANLCRSATQNPVILCGHSRGGLVISQAAEVAPDAVDALVYICAMMMPSGISRADFKARQTPNPTFDAIVKPHPSGSATVIEGDGIPVFAHLCPPDAASAAMARLVAEPSQPRSVVMCLSDTRYGKVPRHYIECTQDRAISIADQRLMQSLSPCESVTTLEADHSPFYSATSALVSALLNISEV
jgi:pimeloyl-ACP methyl ester carboxylesterase